MVTSQDSEVSCLIVLACSMLNRHIVKSTSADMKFRVKSAEEIIKLKDFFPIKSLSLKLQR